GADPGQDRNLLARRDALRMVRVLRQHKCRKDRYGCLLTGRAPDIRAESGRNRRPDVSQSLRSQFLRRKTQRAGRFRGRPAGEHFAIINPAGSPRVSTKGLSHARSPLRDTKLAETRKVRAKPLIPWPTRRLPLQKAAPVGPPVQRISRR